MEEMNLEPERREEETAGPTAEELVAAADEPEETPTEEPAEETPVEEPAEEPAEAPVEETPVEESAAEPVEEASVEDTESSDSDSSDEPMEPKESCECCCSVEETKSAEDMVRDLVNMVNVMKEEEKQDVTTRLDPVAAEELVAKLEELAVKVGEICRCG